MAVLMKFELSEVLNCELDVRTCHYEALLGSQLFREEPWQQHLWADEEADLLLDAALT